MIGSKSYIILSESDLVDYSGIQIFRPLISETSFVAGGCFKDVFQGKPPRDVDVYFTNVDEFVKCEERFRNSRVHTELYSTERSTGFKHSSFDDLTIDLIKYRCGTPIEIINSFDFTICQFALYQEGTEIKAACSPTYFHDLQNHELRFNSFENGASMTFDRVLKYTKYGFNLSDASKSELFDQIRLYTGQVTSTPSGKLSS